MKTFILIIFSFILVGCPENTEVEFTSISKGNLYGAGEEGFGKENIIIASKEDWKSFLLKIDKVNKTSETFEKEINFSKEKIIVAIDKVRNTGGFSIEIESAIQSGKEIIFKVRTLGPKPTDMVTTAIMQPYHIVKIKTTKKNIKFLEL